MEPKIIKALHNTIENDGRDGVGRDIKKRLLAVYLMGSGARGELRKDSDIDLGLLLEPGENMGPLERTHLANRMSYSLKRCVDLGMIDSKNLVYAKEALLFGKRIYIKNESRAALAAATLLGMYLRFNEDRREVLDAYRARFC